MTRVRLVNLSKTYRLYARPVDRLLERLPGSEPRHRAVHALSGVSLQAAPGDSIGVIGENGSGKTTLLRILAGSTAPTAGERRVEGRVSSLLEIGAGFHPEFTGRENIRVVGALWGLDPAALGGKLPEIAEFSELQDYLDWPVRSYSTGMRMRLGFSIAVAVDPDILLLDEVLAVGDESFQCKCLDRVLALRNNRRIFFFGSHDLPRVKLLCDRAVWLDRGKVRADGPANDVTEQYLACLRDRRGRPQPALEPALGPPGREPTAQILSVRAEDDSGADLEEIPTGTDFVIRVEYEVRDPDRQLHLGCALRRNDGEIVFGAATAFSNFLPPMECGRRTVLLRFPDHRLLAGAYRADIYVLDATCLHAFAKHEGGASFNVPFGPMHTGICRLDHEWRMSGGEAPR